MFRRIFAFIYIFLGITCSVFSQSADSLINIKGYYVTRFLKDEISFSFNQKINKLNGESYSTPIDYEKTSFFIPLSINNSLIKNDITTIMSFENNLNKDSIYYLPTSKQIEKYVERVFNLNNDFSKEICIFSEADKFSPYYINTDNDRFLYKFIYIEGFALKKPLLNTEENRFRLHLDIYSVNKESQFIELFFIVKIESYSTIINLEGLKEWVPYNEK